MRALVWFRSDLRVQDNPVLHRACADADHGVISVFLISPKQWREHDWADVKVDFLLRTLHSLREQLKKLNIPLLIDWRRGDRHFMRHLVDGDLANNNGGWQWSASTGTDAVPYCRVFNPYLQSRRFDPRGRFIRRYVPELQRLDAALIHDPTKAPPSIRAGIDYPDPIVEHAAAQQRAIEAFLALRSNAR